MANRPLWHEKLIRRNILVRECACTVARRSYGSFGFKNCLKEESTETVRDLLMHMLPVQHRDAAQVNKDMSETLWRRIGSFEFPDANAVPDCVFACSSLGQNHYLPSCSTVFLP